MSRKKFEDILLDIENPEIHFAGGSVVGFALSITNALIIYISNLTIGKKKYECVQNQVEAILKKAKELKKKSVEIIYEDKNILDKILFAYKRKEDDEEKYKKVLKGAVEFGMDVLKVSFDTYELSEKIEKVGNKMLASDFKICKYYSIASIKSAVENVKVNLNDMNDNEYKDSIEKQYNVLLQKIDLL